MSTDPVRQSPRPPGVDHTHRPDDGPTGLHPATRDFVREVSKSGIWTVAVSVGGFALACLLAGVTTARALAQQAKDAGLEAAKAHETRLVAVEQQVPQLRQEVWELKQQSRFDMKALQDALLTRRPSQRLNQPVPPPTNLPLDGGSP